jgi:hypothetical protein
MWSSSHCSVALMALNFDSLVARKSSSCSAKDSSLSRCREIFFPRHGHKGRKSIEKVSWLEENTLETCP